MSCFIKLFKMIFLLMIIVACTSTNKNSNCYGKKINSKKKCIPTPLENGWILPRENK